MITSRMPRHRTEPTEADVLQGTLDMLILKVVAVRPIHGYAIVQRLRHISNNALVVRQGSLYPALYRLEKRGWLKAHWKPTESGRQAKFYRLTKAGREQLEVETSGWKRLCDAISMVLETAE